MSGSKWKQITAEDVRDFGFTEQDQADCAAYLQAFDNLNDKAMSLGERLRNRYGKGSYSFKVANGSIEFVPLKIKLKKDQNFNQLTDVFTKNSLSKRRA